MAGFLDGILGNLDDIAAKVGIPPEQIQAVTQSLGAKIEGGEGQAAAMAATASEHGLSLEKLQGMLAGLGGTGALEKIGIDPAQGDILGQVTGFLDKDGDGSAIDDLTDMAKGFFGGKS